MYEQCAELIGEVRVVVLLLSWHYVPLYESVYVCMYVCMYGGRKVEGGCTIDQCLCLPLYVCVCVCQSSSTTGEPIVAGLIFSDSRPKNSILPPFARKAVLLGNVSGRRAFTSRSCCMLLCDRTLLDLCLQDKDSLPLLPVLQSGQVSASRFSKEVLHCPLGMISGRRHERCCVCIIMCVLLCLSALQAISRSRSSRSS